MVGHIPSLAHPSVVTGTWRYGDSSTRRIVSPSVSFFELFGFFVQPPFFLFRILLSGSFSGFDGPIAKLAENPRAMAWCVVNVEFVFDQYSNPFGCLEIRFPAVSLCSLFEQLDELLSISVIEFGIRTLIALVVGTFEPFYSLIFQRRLPIRNSRWRYTVILGDLSLSLIRLKKLLSSGD